MRNYLRDNSGNILGYIENNKFYSNSDEFKFNYENGCLYDNFNNILYKIDEKGRITKGSSNEIVGHIDERGNIFDAHNNYRIFSFDSPLTHTDSSSYSDDGGLGLFFIVFIIAFFALGMFGIWIVLFKTADLMAFLVGIYYIITALLITFLAISRLRNNHNPQTMSLIIFFLLFSLIYLLLTGNIVQKITGENIVGEMNGGLIISIEFINFMLSILPYGLSSIIILLYKKIFKK